MSLSSSRNQKVAQRDWEPVYDHIPLLYRAACLTGERIKELELTDMEQGETECFSILFALNYFLGGPAKYAHLKDFDVKVRVTHHELAEDQASVKLISRGNSFIIDMISPRDDVASWYYSNGIFLIFDKLQNIYDKVIFPDIIKHDEQALKICREKFENSQIPGATPACMKEVEYNSMFNVRAVTSYIICGCLRFVDLIVMDDGEDLEVFRNDYKSLDQYVSLFNRALHDTSIVNHLTQASIQSINKEMRAAAIICYQRVHG